MIKEIKKNVNKQKGNFMHRDLWNELRYLQLYATQDNPQVTYTIIDNEMTGLVYKKTIDGRLNNLIKPLFFLIKNK